MDHKLLVDTQIEDGKALIACLTRGGYEVAVAFWVKTSEEGLWSLYIGSRFVGSMPLADAYRVAYLALSQIPDASIPLSQIKLVEPSHPVAANAVEIRDRHPAGMPTDFTGKTLGDISIEEAYVYPRPTGPLKPYEVVQTVAGLLNRPDNLTPSLFILRDGTQIQAVPVGIRLNVPSGGMVQIVLREDLKNGIDIPILVNDVTGIL